MFVIEFNNRMNISGCMMKKLSISLHLKYKCSRFALAHSSYSLYTLLYLPSFLPLANIEYIALLGTIRKTQQIFFSFRFLPCNLGSIGQGYGLAL